MRRQIEFMGKCYDVVAIDVVKNQLLSIEQGPEREVALTWIEDNRYVLKLDGQSEPVEIITKGDSVYIHAFQQIFDLSVINPVEQAAMISGSSANASRAPMPGVLVENHVKPGEKVVRGQPLLTIESMKILTVIKAPRDGEVEKIHVDPGQSFKKGAILVSLIPSGES